MTLLKRRFSDTAYVTGLIFIGISLIIFSLSLLVKTDLEGIFILNFMLTGIYFFIYRHFDNPEAKLHNRFLFLILSLISAFALNRNMEIFEDSAPWFSGLLIIICLNYMAFAWFPVMPSWSKHVVSFVNGISMMTFLYLTCYLLPLLPISLPALLFFGISYHSFVPLLFLIFTFIVQNRVSRKNTYLWLSFSISCILVATICITFLWNWNKTTGKINEIWSNQKTDLPHWIAAAQQIPHNQLTTEILKGDFVYSAPNYGDMFNFWSSSSRDIGECRKHDPLVFIARRFTNPLIMDEDSRIKILRSNHDIQLKEEAVDNGDEDRLWSGWELETRLVNTEVKLWPRCNIAYTEKTISIENTSEWNRNGEAIYTFYMPEGSVVTALSLWINGKEEKGILTTRALADSSYKTIVGRERRDPSVVHWKEGNAVTVRVFPVLPSEQRMFKIGITSPLERINGKLRYENIYFKGPGIEKAAEKTIIDFEQSAQDVEIPTSFVSSTGQFYEKEGRYEPFWGIQINDPGMSGCTFSFGDNSYTLKPYHKKLMPVDFQSVYLDLNRSWTKDEFISIINATKDKTVYVNHGGLIKLDDKNTEQLWEKLHEQQFSLFPLYLINDVSHSLLVTKDAASFMGIDELKESPFLEKTKTFLSRNDRVNVFDLGDDLSLYIRSLQEFRLFRYDTGDADILVHHLKNGQFPEDREDDQQVIIHKTDMVIEKTPLLKDNNGPDHVMRLFSYNHIMQKLGKGLLFDRPIEDSLVQEARRAYVVTPVSSMVVLETQKDYDRFGIRDSKNSLGNAALTSKGAAPEPHEWVLIGLVAIGLFYIIRKKKYQSARA